MVIQEAHYSLINDKNAQLDLLLDKEYGSNYIYYFINGCVHDQCYAN